jgi:ferrochelatase
MLEVAEHYRHFGGKSPLNDQNRELIAALEAEFKQHGIALPIYFGNRNWHPLLTDTLEQMQRDGVRRALAYFTSAYSSYSGCRQYRENILAAQDQVGAAAPRIEKLRMFYNHPLFVEAQAERVRAALAQIPAERRDAAQVIYTAHSIPNAMADNCNYAQQVAETARLVSDALSIRNWRVAYQSRSGPPQQPWLEPDVLDVLRELKAAGDVQDVVIVPSGFLSDHMEVLFDLDTEAKDLAAELGLNLVRAGTVGSHPKFVRMIRDLVEERIQGTPRLAIGEFGPSHDVCPADCCLYTPVRPKS